MMYSFICGCLAACATLTRWNVDFCYCHETWLSVERIVRPRRVRSEPAALHIRGLKMREPKRILVGIDYSEYSREAARYAVILARPFRAKVYFLHVCDVPAFVGSGYGSYHPGSVRHYLKQQKEVEQGALDAVKRFVDEFQEEEIQIRHLVASGSAHVELIRIAKEKAVDLIVIGTHGRAGISQLLIGSVAEKVVRKASCPVLTVKLTDQNFVLPD